MKFRNGSASECPGFRVKFGVVPELDEVLVSVFRSPHSYTGEDMAEISCHASPYIVESLLDRLCAAGARMAHAGEFTQRAFVAGKMDLSQAEAVADLIAADSAASHKLAFSQLRGAYALKLKELRAQILELSALLELELDFSEEDVEFADRGKFRKLALDALAEVERLADSFRLGNAFKRGIPVAIVGAVNSGKSTLLNALLGEERALVSDIPGTTRDTVEEVLVLGGVAYRFIDTAGLREGAETIERMGIERSIAQIGQASVVVALLDSTADTNEHLSVVSAIKAHLQKDTRVIWVKSKSDLVSGSRKGCFDPREMVPGTSGITDGAFCSRLGISKAIELSALTGQGLDELCDAISSADADLLKASEGVLVTNQRHHDALRSAASDLRSFLSGLDSGLPTDLLAEHIRSATATLGAIFGEVTHSEVSGMIFSRFCIGK